MFSDHFDIHQWDEVKASIYSKTAKDVEFALGNRDRSLEDFKALISPAATAYLGNMAEESRRTTLDRFGNTIQMYAPMYLSNECQNICTYCGFSLDNKIPRRTLTKEESRQEMMFLKSQGFDHILLVTGEANRTVGVSYLQRAIRIASQIFSNVSIEVQPLDQEDYELLMHEGLYAVLVYQETYHEGNYKIYHPKGRKSNFHYRLQTADRLGKAGIHKIGIGTLIGLEDWRTDSLFTALHLSYLENTYWRSKYSISFPRLRPFTGEFEPNCPISDAELTQLICAFRLFNPDVELSLSTREAPSFRDNIIRLGITSTSAGSKTNPGGYAVEEESLEQFEIDDQRSPSEFAEVIKSAGYEPVWKDWDAALDQRKHQLSPATSE